MPQWLLGRLLASRDHPNPRFAFQGTINWMRALSILVDNGSFADTIIQDHYKSVARRNVNAQADTMVFSNITMAYHNQASLVRLVEDSIHPYDICRSAIISWYYSIYFSCSAMIAAASGSHQDDHSHTARAWQSDIVDPRMVMSPFSLFLSSLVENVVDTEISAYRGSNTYDLNTYAGNSDEAWGAAISYLKGCWDYEKWRVEERVRESKEFKALGVDNFRTKAAKALRDAQLAKRKVNFLVQSFRYRGKANYRDSIFLSYGDNNIDKLKIFIQDLEKVSRAFQRMAACYISHRVEVGTWPQFIADLQENSRLSIEAKYLNI